MDRIDIEIDDFINYCDYKGLSKKSYASYEQTLKLMTIYLKEKYEIFICFSCRNYYSICLNYIHNIFKQIDK